LLWKCLGGEERNGWEGPEPNLQWAVRSAFGRGKIGDWVAHYLTRFSWAHPEESWGGGGGGFSRIRSLRDPTIHLFIERKRAKKMRYKVQVSVRVGGTGVGTIRLSGGGGSAGLQGKEKEGKTELSGKIGEGRGIGFG